MSHDADVLNRLVARLRSASAGYRRAGADGPGLSDAFGAAAESHDRTAEALAAVVRATGAEPAATGLDAELHAWAHLPRAVTQGGRETADVVERAEAELLQAFQAALEDDDLSAPVRGEVARAFDRVKARPHHARQRLGEIGG